MATLSLLPSLPVQVCSLIQVCSSFAFPLFPLVLFPMLCGYHFNTTLGQRNLSDSWTGFMIFMKPTYALCGFYENCKAHFGSSHSITMVFTHAKALGARGITRFGLCSAPPCAGPYSSKALALRLYLPLSSLQL